MVYLLEEEVGEACQLQASFVRVSCSPNFFFFFSHLCCSFTLYDYPYLFGQLLILINFWIWVFVRSSFLLLIFFDDLPLYFFSFPLFFLPIPHLSLLVILEANQSGRYGHADVSSSRNGHELFYHVFFDLVPRDLYFIFIYFHLLVVFARNQAQGVQVVFLLWIQEQVYCLFYVLNPFRAHIEIHLNHFFLNALIDYQLAFQQRQLQQVFQVLSDQV